MNWCSKDAGRKVRQHLDANGWRLVAIYNTHSNADHIGGNKYLQSQTGCRIYASGIEYDFTRHPILEPSFAHAAVTEEIVPLVQHNIEKVHQIAEDILALCSVPMEFEEILKALFDRYGLTMNFEQYVLVGSTVRSYLTWLKETGNLQAGFTENRLLFHT